MDNWAEIRRRVLADGLSGRAACREYKIHWKTLQKILDNPEPPGYRRTKPRRPSILEPLLPVVHQILEDDKKAPKKQRHSAKRIFERLRAEHGYQGGLTTVKDAVRAWRRRTAEVFVPLSHPPGEAQADFGQAEVILDGEPATVAVFVMTMPYSDAIFTCAFPRECTEAFLEGHVRAFASFGGVPRRISYDNSALAGPLRHPRLLRADRLRRPQAHRRRDDRHGEGRGRGPGGGPAQAVLGPGGGLLRPGPLPGPAGAQARGAGLRGTPGGVGAAG